MLPPGMGKRPKSSEKLPQRAAGVIPARTRSRGRRCEGTSVRGSPTSDRRSALAAREAELRGNGFPSWSLGTRGKGESTARTHESPHPRPLSQRERGVVREHHGKKTNHCHAATCGERSMKPPCKKETLAALGLSTVLATVVASVGLPNPCTAKKRKSHPARDLGRRFGVLSGLKDVWKETRPGTKANPNALTPERLTAQARASSGRPAGGATTPPVVDCHAADP